MKIKIIAASFLTYLFNDVITHIPFHWLRKFYLRLLNKKISKSSIILMHTRILGIWNLEVGDRVVINQYSLLDCRKYSIKIFHDVDIGPYSKIWTLGHDPDSDVHEVYGGEIIIENHVWIASGVTILPNVFIRKGAVIASKSVVVKDVDSLTVVGGNPAKFIRKRKNKLKYKLNYVPILE